MLSTTDLTTTRLTRVLQRIVQDDRLHARLLNTMSYMEHIGATKIAQTQSGPHAGYMSLKHAAEEARHAFYLKKLSLKVAPDACPDYTWPYLLAPVPSRQYLYRLDIAVSRMARRAGLTGTELRQLAYLLVTYAIEVRADDIYPIYESLLNELPHRISVRSIIAEEEGHLAEMEAALACYPSELRNLTSEACAIESQLYLAWLTALEEELS